MSENGDVLTGRLIMPCNSPGSSAGILTDLLARAAPNVVVGVLGGLGFFIYFGVVASLPPQTVATVSICLPGIAPVMSSPLAGMTGTTFTPVITTSPCTANHLPDQLAGLLPD